MKMKRKDCCRNWKRKLIVGRVKKKKTAILILET